MEYRQLGSSGLKVSTVGLGTNNFGGRIDAERSAAVLRQCIDEGINFIDTANIYGRSVSEQHIGETVKGIRSQVLIATKVSGGMGDGPNDKRQLPLSHHGAGGGQPSPSPDRLH